jgi:hypothetical protein
MITVFQYVLKIVMAETRLVVVKVRSSWSRYLL